MSSGKILLPVDEKGNGLHIFAFGAAQNVVCNASGGGSTSSNAFAPSTKAVMVSCTTNDVRIAVGNNPVADANSTLLPKPFMLVIGVPSGGKIAVLSNDATPGSVSVTELLSATFPS